MMQGDNNNIVQSFKMGNILDLSEEEVNILSEIKKIINEECEGLQQDISEV